MQIHLDLRASNLQLAHYTSIGNNMVCRGRQRLEAAASAHVHGSIGPGVNFRVVKRNTAAEEGTWAAFARGIVNNDAVHALALRGQTRRHFGRS
jgi:hypothetical protein